MAREHSRAGSRDARSSTERSLLASRLPARALDASDVAHCAVAFDQRCATGLHPTGGVNEGGTSVTVNGVGFDAFRTQPELASCQWGTTITIAHRLNTIIDSDRVLVIDNGAVAEFDTPAALLAQPDSIFAGLLDEMGPGAADKMRRQVAEAAAAVAAVEAAAANGGAVSVDAVKLNGVGGKNEE